MAATAAAQATTANTTETWVPAGRLRQMAAESNAEVRLKQAGTIKNLYVRLISNTINAASTIQSRKNGANGGQAVFPIANTSGEYEDPTGTDSVAAGDAFCIQTVPGAASGTMGITLMGFLYDATAACVTRAVANQTPTFTNLSTASTTTFSTPWGHIGLITSTTEAHSKVRMRKAMTWKNLGVQVDINGRTTATTIKSRKNGADGNMSISISGSATGFIEEGSPSSDSIAVDDDINYSITTGTGTGSLAIASIQSDLETSTALGIGMLCASTNIAAPSTVGEPVTSNQVVPGFPSWNTTESQIQMKTRFAHDITEFSVFVFANTITSTTYALRVNGADSTLKVTIGASATGLFTDTDTVTVDNNDELNYQAVTTATGGTQSMSIRTASLWTIAAGAAAAVPQSLFIEWEED